MDHRTRPRAVAVVLAVVAVSLAAASVLHLTGHVHGRTTLFDPTDAGIAEALIGAVLAATTITIVTAPDRARVVGLTGTGFAIAGFLVGLTITAQGGHWPDIAYHLSVLPVLVGAFAVLLSRPGRGQAGREVS